MSLIVDVFPKLRTPKYVVKYMCKKSGFKGPLDRQHGKWAKILLQSEGEHGYHIYSHYERN